MSRIGKKPIILEEGVEVEIKEAVIEIKGPNASLKVPILPGIKVEKKDNQIIFTPQNNTKQTLSNWGTIRSLVQNAVFGATRDFAKSLIIEGVGYRAALDGQDLILNLGYSHPVRFSVPEGIKVKVERNTITVGGADKLLVGEMAARIRRLKKPEPYKGKGIRYSNEIIRRKIGKRAVGKTG